MGIIDVFCTGCELIADKSSNLISTCPHKFNKGGVSLDECKGYISQYNGDTINYHPISKDCNVKKCGNETDAKNSLETFEIGGYEVYFCYACKYFILASCPWGPATAHGVGILTELYVI